MKVLFINANCGVGSTGRICTDLYSMLKVKGHEARIAYATTPAIGCDEADTFKIHGKIDYYVHNLLAKATDRTGFFSDRVTKRLIQYIIKENPDIIHLHNIHGYYVNIKILFEFLKQLDKPIVWTLHDCWAFTGHCSHYSYEGCMKWLSGCHHCTQLKSYPVSFGLDSSERNYKDKKNLFTSIPKLWITTPSQWLAHQVKKSFLGKYDIYPIYNGIDLSVFKHVDSNIKSKLGIAKQKKVLLGVSFVWNDRKGFSDMLELDSNLDHNKYQLLLVGLSNEQLKLIPKSILGLARTHSVYELVELYSMADIFINTSYEETMGLVTAEALACGTPAIVYDQTAVPEIVDSTSGFVVSAGHIDSLLKKLDPALKIEPSAAREFALKFEKNKQYEKYYNLYNQILQV